MNLMEFIPKELLIVIAATNVFGVFLKCIDNKYFKDKYIPIVLIIFAITFSVVLTGYSATSILQGVLCWGTATGLSQIVIQSKKGE